MKLLDGKNILVGVTSSIAIYKTLELIRLYIKSGANVKVIMTQNAKKFIAPLTFETLSKNKVLDDLSEDWSNNSTYNHISIGKWADIFVIAPATANTINKLANGIADNILLQSAIAYPNIKLLAPSANTNMLQNPITQANLKMLKLCNFKIIEPVQKELACGDVGSGAMAEPIDIFHKTAQELLQTQYWTNRMVVINGGGTIEKIDEVRYISNFSSGKMASAIATALYYRGANVCMVATKFHNLPQEIHTIEVQSTQEMYEHIQDNLKIAKKEIGINQTKPTLIRKKPYFFGVAAVSDYVVAYPQQGKIKKDDIGASWNLKLKQNIDILKQLDKQDIYAIGFKAELDQTNAQQNALKMLHNKSLDAVCLNILKNSNSFGTDNTSMQLLFKDNQKSKQFVNLPKLQIALDILDTLEQNLKAEE